MFIKQVCASLPILVGTLAYADVTSGLVARYAFDGTAADSSGSGLHGSANGGVSFGPGIHGQAALFNGTDGWVKVDHGGALTFDLDTQSYTVSAFYRSSNGAEGTIIQDRFGSNHAVSYNIISRPGSLSANSWYGTGTGTHFDAKHFAPYNDGQWLHVASTFDAVTGIKRLYVNGQVVAVALRPSEPFTPTAGSSLTIGGYFGSDLIVSSFLDGAIDELRIYNRALSNVEISEIAQFPATAPCVTSLVDSFESDVVGSVPDAWQTRLAGVARSVDNIMAEEADNALKLVAGPFNAAELQSKQAFSTKSGKAVLEFSLLWSGDSTNTGPDCNDIYARYQGEYGVFWFGFVRDANDPTAPLKIAGTSQLVQQNRWYRFKGVADYDRGTVDWYMDGKRVRTCIALEPGVTDPSRKNRIELHVGCIDNGVSVALFDAVTFVPGDPCPADLNTDSTVDDADFVLFAQAYNALLCE